MTLPNSAVTGLGQKVSSLLIREADCYSILAEHLTQNLSDQHIQAKVEHSISERLSCKTKSTMTIFQHLDISN